MADTTAVALVDHWGCVWVVALVVVSVETMVGQWVDSKESVMVWSKAVS